MGPYPPPVGPVVVVDGRRAAVPVTIQIPAELEEGLRELVEQDPEFLNRVVLYGITRRSICRHLQERNTVAASEAEQLDTSTRRMAREVSYHGHPPRRKGVAL